MHVVGKFPSCLHPPAASTNLGAMKSRGTQSTLFDGLNETVLYVRTFNTDSLAEFHGDIGSINNAAGRGI
jgi:hypothetical protein